MPLARVTGWQNASLRERAAHAFGRRAKNRHAYRPHGLGSLSRLRQHMALASHSTSPDAPTGNYRAEMDVGSRMFNHTIKIETVVPFRLKVSLDPKLTERNRALKAELKGAYLFGNPAAHLKASVDVTLQSSTPVFPKFEDFDFVNRAVKFKPITTNIFNSVLDSAGKASVSWRLPSLIGAPARVSFTLRARVLEKGGRPNRTARTLHIDPFPVYVGLGMPDLDYGFARTQSPLEVPVVAVTPDGEAVPGRTLRFGARHGRSRAGQRVWQCRKNSAREIRPHGLAHLAARVAPRRPHRGSRHCICHARQFGTH